MTDKTARPLVPGDEISFFEPGLVLDVGEPGVGMPHPVSTERGQTVCLTANMIANSKDRHGASWLDLVDDEEAQISRWGRVMVRRGPWPKREQVLRKGSTEAFIERDRRRASAVHTFEGDDLQRELRQIDDELGRPSTVQSLGEYVR